MESIVKQAVQEAIVNIIHNTATEKNITKGMLLHESKIHFIPTPYRVLGGLLQSLNIKFGNFIEKLLELIIEHDSYVEALPSSGKKVKFLMTAQTDSLIDYYITSRQLPESPDSCDELFQELSAEIFRIEISSDEAKQSITKDIDALFKSSTGQIIYLEIKYNDDHDTGKFVDINRKFIKTYAGLVNHLGLTDSAQLKPIIYYFNPTKRWGPIYTPSCNVYRGSQLFDEYFNTKFDDIHSYLINLGNDERIINLFDELYKQIRYGKKIAQRNGLTSMNEPTT
jgi:hypothetical protein